MVLACFIGGNVSYLFPIQYRDLTVFFVSFGGLICNKCIALILLKMMLGAYGYKSLRDRVCRPS